MKVVLSLGSNLGDRESNLTDAVKALDSVPGVSALRVSDIYETVPVGYSDQPMFLNLCVEIDLSVPLDVLLGVCLGVEAGMKRVRLFKNGPRIIDIDMILADESSSSDYLQVPHPRMAQRAFVLVPLSDLCGPDGTVCGFDVSKALQNTDVSGVVKYKRWVL